MLGRRGQSAGVMALDEKHLLLSVAVTFEPIPRVDIDLARPSGTALGILEGLVGAREGTSLATAARIARILAREGLGERFFRAFESSCETIGRELPALVPAGHRRHLALLHLTRILFLYFVQAKGWLDGRTDFLRSQVDLCLARRRSIHRQLLQPLFFGTLNRPAAERSRTARRFGHIPFLNGGLFEPHPLERRHRVAVGNDVWRDVFDDLFERFHFTAQESGSAPHHPESVAPDMLGMVFERLMQPQDRRASGSYYTPTRLVAELLHHCLGAWVVQRSELSLEEATAKVRERSTDLRSHWKDITVLDPAAGSGAFLLGALEILVELRFGPGRRGRRRILQRHLFGVDKDPMAVRLAELRLWLAVAAEEPGDRGRRIRPLPNLDCLVRQGDSLHDPLGAVAGLGIHPRSDGRLQATLRRQVVTAHSPDKTRRVGELRRLETAAMRSCLDQAERTLVAELAECRTQATDRTLFGERRGPDRRLRKRIHQVRERVRAVRRYRRTLEHRGQLPWFRFESSFGDVFDRRGGFDLVVGNPPWVRAEELSPAERTRLAGRYRWWRSGSGRGYGHQPDLSVAFLERGLELAADGGILGFLVPAKLLSASYGALAREGLAREATLHLVADLTDSPTARFDAVTYPLALIAGKSRPPPQHHVQTVMEMCDREHDPTVPQGSLTPRARGPWILQGGGVRRVLRNLQGVATVGEQFQIHLGVKTGANRIFLIGRNRLQERLGDIDEWVRPVVRGRDVTAWRAISSTGMLWPCDDRGTAVERLPASLKRYFESYRGVLCHRSDYRNGAPWQLFRTGPACAPHRVVWADLARRLGACPLVGPASRSLVPLNTCYVMELADDDATVALAAWLNSTWIRTLARVSAAMARGGYARFNAATVASLPLPPEVLGNRTLQRLGHTSLAGANCRSDIDELTGRILELDSAARGALERPEETAC